MKNVDFYYWPNFERVLFFLPQTLDSCSIYCAFLLPYLNIITGKNLCNITTAFRYINAFADWMSVAMIAVSRCLTLTKPELGQKLFSGNYGKLIIGKSNY